MISSADVVNSDRILKQYFSCVKFDPQGKLDPLRLAVLLLLLPLGLFLVFSCITSAEHRFSRSSLTSPVTPDDPDTYLGMSFLGDTMVWPYFLLVPTILVTLRYAINKTVELLNASHQMVLPQVLTDPARRAAYDVILNQANSDLRYTGPTWRLLYWVAVLAGFGAFSFNTLTSINAPSLPSWIQPYTSDSPTVLPYCVAVTFKALPALISLHGTGEGGPWLPPSVAGRLRILPPIRQLVWSGRMTGTDKQILSVLSPSKDWQETIGYLYRIKTKGYKSPQAQQVALKKWDADVREAPLSWVAARVWVLLLSYALLPLVFLRIWNLVVVVRSIVKKLTTQGMLQVDPRSLDPRKNLEPVTDTLLFINYISTMFLVLFMLSFFREGLEPAWYNYLLLIFVPVIVGLFVGPLISISQVIEVEKDRQLREHSTVLDNVREQLATASSAVVAKTHAELLDCIAKYEAYGERLQSASAFPVTGTTITKFVASVSIPILITLLEKLAGDFVQI